MAKTDGVARIIALAALGKNGGSGTGGTTNYLELANKPKINNVELTGNKTLEDLGINIPDLENYYTKDIVNEALSKKQDTLIAGKNIIINGEVINAADDVIPTYILQTNIRPKYNKSVEFTDVYDDLGKIINDNPGKTVHLCLYIPANGKYVNSAYYGTTVCPDIRTSEASGHIFQPFMIMNQNKARIILRLELDIDKTVSPHKAVVRKFSCDEGPTEYAVTKDIENVENRTMEMVMMMLEDSNNNFLAKTNTTEFVPTGDYNPATKKYVDDNVKTYTAGENIIISEDNVISANVSGGTDGNAVYTYYAPYSDDDWFTEGNVANILQTVKDKGYSNFELCTLNGSHYALRKGGNLQALTTTEEYYELEYLPNDLKNYVYYFFVARLNEGGKIVVDGLGTQTYTAQEMVETYLSPTLEKISGYDGSASHLILQSNNGIFEWDSSLDGGIFGDSYTDPAYYTEKQVDKIVTDTVNEALGGKY